jgi:hypothetical protein
VQRYPEDIRVIVVCGMRDDNVHVEWCNEKDYPQVSELAQERLDAEYGTGTTYRSRRYKK